MQPFAQQSYMPANTLSPPQTARVATLIDTIAHRNFAEAAQLMAQHGYSQAQNITQLTKQLAHFILVNGDEAIRQLSFVHPDKEMILDHQKANTNKGFSNFSGDGNFAGQPSYTYNNCTGCGGNCAKHNNIDGAANNTATSLSMSSHNTINILAVLAFVVIAFTALRK